MNTIERLTWWIWETSLTASWAMLIALPLLLVFRKPAFAQARYWIGLLVIARLVFPISFQSELSVQNYVPSAAASAVEVVHEAPVYLDNPSAPKPSRIFPLLWLSGALALAARVLIQQWKVRRWIRVGQRVSLEALDEARMLMPVRRKIAVYVVPQITTPALCGLFRPKLLLPPSALEHANLRMIFLHELAHIRRWDVLAKWALIAARTLHWFNPLVWLITRRMEADQELLCDAAALRALNSDDQKRYGETLLALASDTRPASATLLPISGNFKQMKERIGMITHFKPATRRSLFLAAAVATVFSFLAFTSAVEKEAPSVAKATKLNVEIPKGDQTERTLNILREEFEKLTLRIESREHELDNYRSKLGIAGPLASEDALAVSEKIGTLERERLRLEQEGSKARQTLATLKKAKTPEKTRVAVSLAYPNDERLNRFLADLGKIEQQFTTAREEYSGDHPEMKRLVALMKNINQVIDTHVEGVLIGLETVVTSQEEQLAKIDSMIAKARAEDSNIRRMARPYFNTKRDIETMRAVRDSLHARLLQTEIEARVAKAGE